MSPREGDKTFRAGLINRAGSFHVGSKPRLPLWLAIAAGSRRALSAQVSDVGFGFNFTDEAVVHCRSACESQLTKQPIRTQEISPVYVSCHSVRSPGETSACHARRSHRP